MTVSIQWKSEVASAEASATLKALLVGATYALSPAHRFVDDIVPGSNEVSGTGYSRLTLSSVAASIDAPNQRAVLTFADLVWPALDAGDIRGCWIYRYVTNDGDSPLRYFQAFTRSSNGGDFRLRVPATGAVWIAEG